MAVTAPVDMWVERRRRAGELRARQPFVRQVLDFYGALLPVQEEAFRRAAIDAPPPNHLVSYVAEVVVPRVLDVSIALGPDRLRAELLETQHPREIIETWIAGEDQTPADRFLARASVEAVGDRVSTIGTGPRESLHCPQCGGLPQLSYFAQAAEDLSSGPRLLLCARCGSSWGYARMTCPGCGEDSSGKLLVLSEEGTTSGERGNVVRGLPGAAPSSVAAAVFPHMRIEACESCRHYLLNVDLAIDPQAVPVVDELAAIPLDLVARERGFTKIIPNLMGF
jgi:Protein involved in formate dehydrogenase formation